MKEFHSVIDKTGLAHIVDENNQYYQPTIRTAINDEKQQLIKFLEEKTKECDDTIKLFLKKNDGSMFNGIEIAHLQDFKNIFQEVLDFVRGDK